MYIARGPSKGRYNIPQAHIFEPLPQLQADVAERYEKAYPNDAFRKLQGPIGDYNHELSRECKDKQAHTQRLLQRPWHDAESAMLVFLIFLLRCRPKDSAEETQNDLYPFQEIYQSLRKTPIGSVVDIRDNLIRSHWDVFLHADLVHLESSIQSMCSALRVDYEFLVPAPGVNAELILHEIFQRQLFQLYCHLKEGKPGEAGDVILDTSSYRPFYIDDERRISVLSADPASSNRCPTTPESFYADAPQPLRGSKRHREDPKSSLESKADGVSGGGDMEVDDKELDGADGTVDSQRDSKRPRTNGKTKIKDKMKRRGSPKETTSYSPIPRSTDEVEEEEDGGEWPSQRLGISDDPEGQKRVGTYVKVLKSFLAV
ncbi:hypothetical protein D9758_005930 [Tetrapyrgos nigripes]|uniref:Uncharacterized protein n=1 Tax=Tetrapyrgos nigripes TaxID=182062 RepID=A0A8H5G315_9AGAR|nr:hypothetical protein D9758_005930 [Tetrapyrgos nigripes]